MPASFDLFDLAARITADTKGAEQNLTNLQKKVIDAANQFKNLDKSAEKTAATHKTLAANVTSTSQAMNALGSQINRVLLSNAGLNSQMVGLISAGAGLNTALASIAAGLAATGAAAVAAGAGIYELSKQAADYGQSIYKAQASTGLSAQTLSVLKVISAETGTAFESLTMSAARMQVAISKGFTQPTNEAAKALQVLHLNTDEFRRAAPDEQFLKIAHALQETTTQGDKNRAALALVSRGFNVSASALKEFGDQYEETYKKADAFGLLLGQREVEDAHKFTVAIADLSLMVEGFGVQAGERTMPMIINALHDLGTALGLNIGDWKNWGRDVGEILAHAVGAAEVAASLIANSLRAAARTPISTAQGILAGASQAYWTGNIGAGIGTALQMAGAPTAQAGAAVAASAAHVQSNLWAMMANSRFGGAGTGGGAGGGPGTFPARGGGGGKGAKESIDEVTAALAKQNEQIHEAWAQTDKYQKTIDDLVRSLGNKHKALTDDQKAQLEANAETLRGIDLMHSWWDFLRTQERGIDDARTGLDQYDKAVREWEDGERKAGRAVTDGMHAIAMRNAELQRTIGLTRQRIALEQTLIDRQERPRVVSDVQMARALGIDLDTEAQGDVRLRRTTDWMKDKIQPFAQDLSRLIGDSIQTGFQDGMKAGLLEFAKGILQMIESKMLTKLADAITDAIMKGISNAQGNSTSGGILGTAAHILIGLIGGGLGGVTGLGGSLNGVTAGVGGAVGHASGGLINEPIVGFGLRSGLVHTFGERGPETIIPGIGTGASNVNITVYARDAQSFQSRSTQRQISEQYRRALLKNAA